MIDLQLNFPVLPSQKTQWRERLLAAVETTTADGLRTLQPSFKGGADRPREIAAAWLRQPLEQVWLTSGGHHGCLVALFAGDLVGKTIAVDEFTYPGFKEQARLLGSRLAGCAADAQGLCPDALRELCRRERAAGTPVAALFTMPTVHNPLGVTIPLARRHAIVEIAREYDLLLIQDDAYAYLDDAPPPTFLELAPERTFYVYGLAKSLAAAARTGFFVGPARFADAIGSAIRQTSTGVSNLLSTAACSMVEDGSYATLMQAKRDEGRRRNAEARAMLGEACAPGVPCAWYLWLHLPEGLTSEQFEQHMAELGVGVHGGHWAAVSDDLPQCFRVSLGGETEWSRVCEGLALVAGAIKGVASTR